MAKLNLGRVGLVPAGSYDSAKTYMKLDVVYYPATGSSYVSLIDNNSAAPSDAARWQSLADVSNQVAAANAATERANTAAAAAEAVSGEITDMKSALNYNYLNRFNFLAFEQGALNTGSGNPLDNPNFVRTVTKIAVPMHVNTGSDAYVIAGAFSYNVADDSFISYSAVGRRSLDIDPDTGTYVRFTVRRTNQTAISPTDIQPELFATKMTENAANTESNTDALKTTETITYAFVRDSYINNASSIGTIINMTPVADTAYACIVVPCRIGDVFRMTGRGGGVQRLYSFVTDSYKQVKAAPQNATASDTEYTAPANGYFVANVQKAYDYSLEVTHRIRLEEFSSMVRGMGEAAIDYSPLFIKGSIIVDNVAVGSAVDVTPTANDAYGHAIVKCVGGDKFILSGRGGTSGLVWCFTDREYRKLSGATVITVSDLELIAQRDGYLIVNAQQTVPYSLVKVGYYDPTVLQDLYNSLPVRFIMPSSIYGISGDSMYAYTPEMFANWKHLNNYQLTLSGLANAQSIQDSEAPRMILPLAAKNLKMSLQNYRNNETVNKTVSVKTVSSSSLSVISARVLVIGDSFIRYKWGNGILKYMSDFAESDGIELTFIGTATTGYGYSAEGRGGWSAMDYLTHYVPTVERDPSATDEQKKVSSPFVFSDNDTVEDAYFDFAKYLTVNNLAAPDIIIISLGMNDGNTSADAINAMVADIHGSHPDIPIIISMIPTVPKRINTGDFYNRKTTRENQNLSYITKFNGRESEKIYISPEHLALDGILGLTGSEQNVNPVSLAEGDEVMETVNTGIHPTAIGAWNIAKWKYETLVYVMQQI